MEQTRDNEPTQQPDPAPSAQPVPHPTDEVPVQDVQGAAAVPAEQADEQVSESQQRERAASVEAILFATDTPLTAARIAQVADLGSQRAVKQAIGQLNERYEQIGSAFRIEEIAGGYQMLTLPQYHDVLGRLLRVKADTKLSNAALETLAVVAYRQPLLRADVEAIRGVACGEVLRSLMEKQLVKIVGRAEVIGRPMLYGTTRRFLEVFGLANLDDLPRVEELRGGAKELAKTPAPTPDAPVEATPAPAPKPQPGIATDQTPDATTPANPEPESA